jgi:hypothetical protein
VSGVDVGATGVAVGVGAMVAAAVGERVREAVGATVAPQAARPTVAIAALMIAVTFMVVTDQRGRCIRGYVRTKCVERVRWTTRPGKRGDGDALKRSGPGRTSPSQRGGVSRMRPSSCRNIRCPHRMIPLRGTEHRGWRSPRASGWVRLPIEFLMAIRSESSSQVSDVAEHPLRGFDAQCFRVFDPQLTHQCHWRRMTKRREAGSLVSEVHVQVVIGLAGSTFSDVRTLVRNHPSTMTPRRRVRPAETTTLGERSRNGIGFPPGHRVSPSHRRAGEDRIDL